MCGFKTLGEGHDVLDFPTIMSRPGDLLSVKSEYCFKIIEREWVDIYVQCIRLFDVLGVKDPTDLRWFSQEFLNQLALLFSTEPPLSRMEDFDFLPGSRFIVFQAAASCFSVCSLTNLSISYWMYPASTLARASFTIFFPSTIGSQS